MARPCKPISERFWPKVDKSGECWLWTGYVRKDGYGEIGRGRAGEGMALVHRVVYELERGPIPPGLDIDHQCHNVATGCPGGWACLHRRCVNPAHLEPATRQTNLRRGSTIIADAAARTHCPAGHPYDAENTHIRPNGDRQCRECHRRRQGPYEARQRAYVPKPRHVH